MKKENNYIIIRIRILILIKGRVRIASTNITENFVKILLRELKTFENHRESNKSFLARAPAPGLRTSH